MSDLSKTIRADAVYTGKALAELGFTHAKSTTSRSPPSAAAPPDPAERSFP